MRHSTVVSAVLAAALACGVPASAQTPPAAPAPSAQPVAPAPSMAPSSPAASGQAGPAGSLEPRIVRPKDITVISGSRFRVGNDRYQVFGVRSPRPRAGQCVMERLRGRQARGTLRRILSRGEIRIAPTGQLNALGDKLARVSVDGQSVRRRLIDARAALPRRGNEGFNPWCISLRRPPA
ncbi:MAG TPA: hypothetical protein VF601_11870 [Beijerinckiaceae bacterium]